MSTVDITLALLLTFSALRSYGRGLFRTLAGFAAPVLAFMVAGDWSDPVRDWLAGVMPAPDFILDLLAPAIVFVGVVVVVRVLAALLAKLLGVGLSVPSRVLAMIAGMLLTGCVLGILIVLLHSFVPEAVATKPDDPGAQVAEPVSDFLARLDQQVSNSVLGPRLADLAELVLSEALPPHAEEAGKHADQSGKQTDASGKVAAGKQADASGKVEAGKQTDASGKVESVKQTDASGKQASESVKHTDEAGKQQPASAGDKPK